MKTVSERFEELVKIATTSSEDSSTCPSTPQQWDMAHFLANELTDMGLSEVRVSPEGYVYAELPATAEGFWRIGFISHMDTSPDAPGEHVVPTLTKNYDGGDICLPHTTLSPALFPELKAYVGQDIYTSDGSTLLGADDKAGIAEILTALDTLAHQPQIPHGRIAVGFTPDEEIGRGADRFDVTGFGCDFAYTVDGGSLGELEWENFNAASATITILGRNVHPGSAKGIMINALLLASEFAMSLPSTETPSQTEGREGFFHLHHLTGDVSSATMRYLIRDFEKEEFEGRKEMLLAVRDHLNKKYGPCVTVDIQDQYYNMAEQILPHPEIVSLAKTAMQQVGVTPDERPIRGGTDGARLSFEGLPCPNLFTGGHNFHGEQEFIPSQRMEKAVDVLIQLAKIAKK